MAKFPLPVDQIPETPPRSIDACLRHWADRAPDAPAIAAPGRSALSYGRLAAQMEETVSALRAVHVGRSDRVALVLPQGPEMAVAFLAIAAGASCAPLNPAYRAEEFEFYLSDLGAAALIVQSGIDSPARAVASARGIPVIELEPLAEAEAGVFTLHTGNPARRDPGALAGPDDVALLLHTSGTTSRPKLVPLTHANIMVSAHNIRGTLGLTEADRCLSVMPLFHIHGLIGAVLSSLVAGATVICPPGFYAPKFFAWIDECRPTWYTAVPTMHRAILERAAANREIIRRNPLRFVRSSSAPLQPRVMTELEEMFGAPVIEAYGMTEASHQVTSNPLPPRRRKAGSVGPAAGPEVAVMDATGRVLPPGECGEIVIRGANVTPGYEHDAEANGSGFAREWFRTGDEGYVDQDGYLFITGRIKEIINRGGEKIAPAEIEAVLLDHSAVAEAVVFAAPHPQLGEDVAAAVVLRDGRAVTERTIQEFALERLADYKVPRHVLIVDKIPRGVTGKLERIGLAQKLGLGANGHRRPDAPPACQAQRGPVEEQLARIWCQVLGVERVNVDDNFFELGGDSVLAAQILSRVRDEMQTELSFRVFFETPTVAGMRMSIETARQAARASSIPSIPRHGTLALSLNEERLWFLDQLEPGNPHYNRPAWFRLSGPLNEDALRQSLDKIARRHEVLRTTFSSAFGRPFRVISSRLTFPMSVEDLRQLPERDREAEARRLASEEARRPFNLSQGPLARALLLRLSEEEHLLVLTFHHIVFDGWSEGVLLRELSTLYEAFRAGRPSPLPELPVQYADFAQWQRKWLQSEVLERHLSYWKRRFSGAPPALELPTDRPRPSVQNFRGARQPLALSPALSDALKTLSRREGVTLFMTLLAVFQALLRRYTNQDDISVGTFTATRDRSETEGLLGFFVNNLALRVNLPGDPKFCELLRRVREVTLGAFSHQDLPFEKLLHALRPKRDPGRPPLFQVMLVLKNTPKPSLETSGLTFARCPTVEMGRSNFDLTLWLSEESGGLAGSMEYNTDLFDAATIKGMLRYFEVLLESLAANPDQRLSDLPPPEQRQSPDGRGGDDHAGNGQAPSGLLGPVEERTPSAGNAAPPRGEKLAERRARLSPAKRALLERRLRGEPSAAPVETVEHQLVRIWEELLAARPIGIRDDFFELGGDAALASRMMDRIEQVCGKRPPIETFHGGVTIERLARALVERQVLDSSSLLMKVQSGGARTPIFFVHADLRGGGFYCLDLARELGEDRPFYSLAMHGLNGEPAPPTIEAMAESYIETMRGVRPEGPYILGGLCYGGMVAYEMARRLEREGQQVDLVFMIASFGMNSHVAWLHRLIWGVGLLVGLSQERRGDLFGVWHTRLLRAHYLYRRVKARIRLVKFWIRFTACHPVHAAKRFYWWSLALTRASGSPAGAQLLSTVPPPAQKNDPRERIVQRVLKAVGNAVRAHLPQRYPGRVALFWPNEVAVDHRGDPTVGWGRVARQLDVYSVPGGFTTSITTHVNILVDHLKVCLAEAEARDHGAAGKCASDLPNGA